MVEVLGYEFDLASNVDLTVIFVGVILGILAVCLVIYFIWLRMQYKHKIRIRQLANKRTSPYDDFAREKKDKDGNIWWYLWSSREKFPVPPNKAVEIGSKGLKYVEAYRTETGEIIYLTDNPKVKHISQDILSIRDPDERKKKIMALHADGEVLDFFKPLTTNQRLIYIDQIRKAQERKGKDWKDYIMPIASMGILIIFVISLMIFWGDMVKPFMEMADKQLALTTLQNEQLELLRDIKNDVQYLRGENGGGAGEVAPN